MSDIVRKKVAADNGWYTGDQRAAQLGTPGARWALKGRWNLFARVIDRWLATGGAPVRRVRVLDAGCGDGINMTVLRDLLSARGIATEIVGSDYNRLRLARATADGRFPVIEADLRMLPFPDAAFDLVLCSHVLEHIREDVAAMGELARVVDPRGLVVVAVPNEGCATARLRNHVVQRSILSTTDHVQFYTAAPLVGRARTAGLALLGAVEREGVFLPHFGVYTRLRETAIGRRLISFFVRAAPSQAAGLVAGFTRIR